MNMRYYHTNLRCEACVSAIRPEMDRVVGAAGWSVDLASPEKVLRTQADRAVVEPILQAAGYQIVAEREASAAPAAVADEKPVTYYPLILVLLFLGGGTLVAQLRLPAWDGMRAMNDFMGLFFLTFAFFKLLDVPAFASAYAGYDLLAQRMNMWGYVYPFVELSLGVLYLMPMVPWPVHAVTLVLMSLGAAGVAQTLLDRRKIRCVCLGNVFNLPMSFVSLAEDAGMAVMAAAMLVLEGQAYFRT
jgi:hypothetical protein